MTMAEASGPDAGAVRVDDLADELAHAVLAGADLGDLVDTISGALGVEIAVTTTDGRERATRFSVAMRARLVDADLTHQPGRLPVEPLGLTEHQPLEGITSHRVPVATPTQPLGHLVAFADHDLDRAHTVALGRAATAVALSISREQAVSAVENKYRGDFLRDLAGVDVLQS
jgi:purine catabolism regulator